MTILKYPGLGEAYTTLPGVDLSRLRPDTLLTFQNMAKEYQNATGRKIQVNSGYRDPAKQAELYRADPLHNAPPGRSMHQYGYALDIQSTDANALETAGLLQKYGFWRPLMQSHIRNKESWHIEPRGLKYDTIRAGAVKVSGAVLAVGVVILLLLLTGKGRG